MMYAKKGECVRGPCLTHPSEVREIDIAAKLRWMMNKKTMQVECLIARALDKYV